MFSSLSTQPMPLPAAFEVMRAGLLNQSALTQRHLSTMGHLVRSASAQAQTRLTGTPADAMLAQQAMALTTLADSVVGMARVLSDLHTKSAAELLSWWELQLQAVAPWTDGAQAAAAPVDATLEPSADATPPARTATSTPVPLETAPAAVEPKPDAAAAAPRSRTASRKRAAPAAGQGKTAPTRKTAATKQAAVKKQPAGKRTGSTVAGAAKKKATAKK